eukprot:s5091_g3.t1
MANPHPAGNPNVGQDPTDSELRELSRKFEELLRRCEQTRAKEGEHQEKQFPDTTGIANLTSPSPPGCPRIRPFSSRPRRKTAWRLSSPRRIGRIEVDLTGRLYVEGGEVGLCIAWVMFWATCHFVMAVPAGVLERVMANDPQAKHGGQRQRSVYLRRLCRRQLYCLLSLIGAVGLMIRSQEMVALNTALCSPSPAAGLSARLQLAPPGCIQYGLWALGCKPLGGSQLQRLFGWRTGQQGSSRNSRSFDSSFPGKIGLVRLCSFFRGTAGLSAPSLGCCSDVCRAPLAPPAGLHRNTSTPLRIAGAALDSSRALADVGAPIHVVQVDVSTELRQRALAIHVHLLRGRAGGANRTLRLLFALAASLSYGFTGLQDELSKLQLADLLLYHSASIFFSVWNYSFLSVLDAWSRADVAAAAPPDLSEDADERSDAEPSEPEACALYEVDEEVLSSKGESGFLWLAIEGAVYDLSLWHEHPGGVEVLRQVAGKDATAEWRQVCPATCSSLASVSRYQVGALRLPPREYRIYEHPVEEDAMRRLDEHCIPAICTEYIKDGLRVAGSRALGIQARFVSAWPNASTPFRILTEFTLPSLVFGVIGLQVFLQHIQMFSEETVPWKVSSPGPLCGLLAAVGAGNLECAPAARSFVSEIRRGRQYDFG